MLFEEAARGARVVLASREAIRFGIRPAMPLAEAQALAGAVPATPSGLSHSPGQSGTAVLFLRHEPSEDLQHLEELRRFCQQFSPVVVLAPGTHPDALLLDMTGCERLYGSEDSMVRRVGEALGRRGYVCRIALADTPLAARALARLIPLPSRTNPVDLLCIGRLSAPRAHWRSGPSPAVEWVIARAGHMSQIARYLPVESLELPRELVEQLRSLGIRFVAQLISLPRLSLQERFGTLLLDRLDYLLGLKDEELLPPEEAVQINEVWQFDLPTDNADLIQYVLDHLLRRTTRTLQTTGLGVLHLVVVLYFESLFPKEIHISIFHPTWSYAHLKDLVRLQIDGLQIEDRVTGIRLEATDLAPVTARQRSLFPSLLADTDSSRLSTLAERLANRLGPERVLLVQKVPEPLPEHALRYLSFRPRRSARNDAEPTPESAPRPLRLLKKPEPIQVQRTTLHGFPATFIWRGSSWQAHRFSEVERIESGWWRSRTVRRDYFQLECSTGTLLWVFRDVNRGKWYVHGIYE